MVDINGFEKELNDGVRYPVYLFEGEDGYFGIRGLLLLKNNLISEPELNYAEFSEKSEMVEIISSLNTFPFMSDYRITVLKEFYPNKSDFKLLSSNLGDLNEKSILVIINVKTNADLKKLPSVCVVDCKKWKANLVSKWIISKCRQESVAIDGVAAERIAEYCLCDMCRVNNEVDKLCAYVGKDNLITEKIVNELVWRDNDNKIYEMTEFICRRKFDKALGIIYDMLSRGESTQRLFVSIYNHFRRMLHIAISGENDVNLAKILGVHEYVVKKTREQAKFFKVKSLKKAVDFLIDSDFQIKRGVKGIDETFWLALYKIMTED